MSTTIQDVSSSVLRLGSTPATTPKVVSSASKASDKVTISGTAVQKAATVVSYIDKIKNSGDLRIDALLAGGSAWWHTTGASGIVPSSTARHNLTYSFL